MLNLNCPGITSPDGEVRIKKAREGMYVICRMPTAHLGQNGEDVAERVEEECKYLIIA